MTDVQQAVPVAQEDWRLIAKAAGEHGVRYRTNTALLAFLDEIEPARKADRFDPALPCKSGEGADYVRGVSKKVLENAADLLHQYAAFIRDDVKADDLERHPYAPEIDQTIDDLRALTPDATQTREAEGELYLVWSNEHRAWWGKDQRGYTKIIANAGRYDRDTALTIAGTRGGGWLLNKGNPDEIAIPEVDAIDQYASITAEQFNARGGA